MSKTESIDTISPRDTNEHTINNHQGDTTTASLYRIISTLDAEIHVTLEATDDIDGTNFTETESLPIGGETGDPDDNTKSIAAGDVTKQVESTLLTEGWPWLQFGITPQTVPTAGSVEIREVEDI